MAFQMWLQIPSQGHSSFDVNATLDPRRSVTLVFSWVALYPPIAFQIWPQIPRHRHTSFDVNATPDPLLSFPWIAIWLSRCGYKFQVRAIPSSMSMQHLIHDAVLLLYFLGWPCSLPNLATDSTSPPYLP